MTRRRAAMRVWSATFALAFAGALAFSSCKQSGGGVDGAGGNATGGTGGATASSSPSASSSAGTSSSTSASTTGSSSGSSGCAGHSCTSSSDCCSGTYCGGTPATCVACVKDGSTCGANVECCGGHCDATTHVCATPGTCAKSGASCSSQSDCCAGTYCGGSPETCIQCVPDGSACGANVECCSSDCDATLHVCGKPTSCRTSGESCGVDGDCCSGLHCILGACGNCGGSTPQLCPPANGVPEACWGAGTDCSSIADCSGQYLGCTGSGLSIDCATMKCTCANPSDPVYCPASGGAPEGCWPSGVVCSTVTTCNGVPKACMNASEHIDCTTMKCVQACFSDGEGCSNKDQCCGGFCNGVDRCGCSMPGYSGSAGGCKSDLDCCSGSCDLDDATDGFCCTLGTYGTPCNSGADCCSTVCDSVSRLCCGGALGCP